MTSSTGSGFAMPPEWVRHERTWMEFPPANITFGNDPDGDLGEYRRVWAAVTNAIARFEPVTLICNIGDRAAAEVEAELKSRLGVDKVLWLERGLTKDYMTFGTRGHIDIVASWVRPGLVVAHSQPDPTHPDHEVCKENLARLRASTDARGRT